MKRTQLVDSVAAFVIAAYASLLELNTELDPITIGACTVGTSVAILELMRLHRLGRPASIGTALAFATLIGVTARSVSPDYEVKVLNELLPTSGRSFELSLLYCAVGLAVALLTYRGLSRRLARIKRPLRTVRVTREPSPMMLVLLTGAVVVARAGLQSRFGLGVVGATPELPFVGVLHYATHGGILLLSGACLIRTRTTQSSGLVATSLAGYATFAYLGSRGGSRGAVVQAVLGLALAALVRSPHLRLKAAAGLLIAIPLSLSLFGAITTTRAGVGTEHSHRSSLERAYIRLGGAPSLAPIVDRIDAGSVSVRDATVGLENFVKTRVYGLPPAARTGQATTIWGLGYLTGGFLGVVLLAVVVGVCAARADVWLSQRQFALSGGLRAVLVLTSYNLLQEGVLMTALKGAILFVLTVVVLEWIVSHRAPQDMPLGLVRSAHGGQRAVSDAGS